MRIEADTRSAKVWVILLKAMEEESKIFKPLEGMAPRGAMERKLQNWLETGEFTWKDFNNEDEDQD